MLLRFELRSLFILSAGFHFLSADFNLFKWRNKKNSNTAKRKYNSIKLSSNSNRRYCSAQQIDSATKSPFNPLSLADTWPKCAAVSAILVIVVVVVVAAALSIWEPPRSLSFLCTSLNLISSHQWALSQWRTTVLIALTPHRNRLVTVKCFKGKCTAATECARPFFYSLTHTLPHPLSLSNNFSMAALFNQNSLVKNTGDW